MIESNLNAGSQKILSNPNDMEYGVSVTDGCIDWETTEASILEMADKLRDVLKTRNQGKEWTQIYIEYKLKTSNIWLVFVNIKIKNFSRWLIIISKSYGWKNSLSI